MKKHKQSRNPKEKISKLPKKQVVHRKKGNRALKFKQTMATNLGNTRSSVETTLMLEGRHLGILF